MNMYRSVQSIGDCLQIVTDLFSVYGSENRTQQTPLKGLYHGQKCLHLFSDSEAYHEQMGSIPSSNGTLDIALLNVLKALGDAFFRLLMQQNWPQDRKLTETCWRLHWFLGLHADVWENLFQVHIRLVVMQVWIKKMYNKNIEIRFQSAACHLCQRVLVQFLCNKKGPKATASIEGKGKPGKAVLITSVLSNITFNYEFYSMLWGSKDH